MSRWSRWSQWRQPRARVTALNLVVLGVSIALMLRPAPEWWFGGAGGAGAAVALIRTWMPELERLYTWLMQTRSWRGRTFQWGPLLLDVAYVAVLSGIATFMLRDVAAGDRIVSHDHTVHYTKAWELHRNLAQGKLYGWSHGWFAGYPFNYLYPIGTDLWINLVYALGFGALTFSQAYGVAFWLFHVFTGFSGYKFGRMVGGPHVGLIAGLLAITDSSEFRYGGWVYTVEYGVWPQGLSLCFSLLAFCYLPSLVERRRAQDIAWFALWMGLAILCHPIQLLFMPVALGAAVFASILVPKIRAATATLRLGLATLLSLLIACIWLMPFFTARKETDAMGVWWETTYDMGRSLLSLGALPGTLGYVLSLGMFAVLVLLSARRFSLLFTALVAIAVPVLFSNTFIDEFHLPFVSEAFTRVQLMRMSTMVKPFWFTLSAYLVVALVRYPARLVMDRVEAHEAAGQERPLKSAMLAALVALFLLPILVPAAQDFWTRQVDRKVVVDSERPFAAERQELLKWLKENLPNDGFYRVGIMTGHDHNFMDLATEIPHPTFKRGFTPCSNFIYKMRSEEPGLLIGVNLRYAISKRGLENEDFELIKHFGMLKVYRFRHWQRDPFEVIEGSGDVKVERFADEEIVLRAAPGSSGKLRLNVSYFSRWSATLNGRRIPIGLTRFTDIEDPLSTGFMTVALAPGEYRFVFTRTFADNAGFYVTLLGLLIAVLLWVPWRVRPLLLAERGFERIASWTDQFSEPRWAMLRQAALWLLVLGALGTGLGLARWIPHVAPADSNVAISRIRYDFLESLKDARAEIAYREGPRRCRRFRDRLICRDKEGNLDIDRYISSFPTTIEEYTMVRCIKVWPEEDAVTHLEFPAVPVGQAITGYYGISRTGRLLLKTRPVDFTIRIDGEVVYDEKTERDSHMHWFSAPMRIPGKVTRETATVTFSVHADQPRKRHFCFYAQVVDL